MKTSKLTRYGLEIIAFLVLSITGVAQPKVLSPKFVAEANRIGT